MNNNFIYVVEVCLCTKEEYKRGEYDWNELKTFKKDELDDAINFFEDNKIDTRKSADKNFWKNGVQVTRLRKCCDYDILEVSNEELEKYTELDLEYEEYPIAYYCEDRNGEYNG